MMFAAAIVPFLLMLPFSAADDDPCLIYDDGPVIFLEGDEDKCPNTGGMEMSFTDYNVGVEPNYFGVKFQQQQEIELVYILHDAGEMDECYNLTDWPNYTKTDIQGECGPDGYFDVQIFLQDSDFMNSSDPVMVATPEHCNGAEAANGACLYSKRFACYSRCESLPPTREPSEDDGEDDEDDYDDEDWDDESPSPSPKPVDPLECGEEEIIG